ncbi:MULTISPECIES: hypothetical protein [unclassified Ensifer]|uniref:hypothetical protein n=1 Tax=unclassified Ensifer TaxID=2633371 RepID=UPI000813227C|nr:MULTISPECIES: hypothetical protein [unclassified Ensifer]OCP07981.1 hypothetical protein BC362_10245 [Ensifer sp. LC14]OCP10909.1 hypothetical protein BC374_17720 [Ensifer sp. LC13]OCP11545.1 hypothetical protein BBX50_18135 [Ensifer sp. LC11]OCP33364.1 hypothetical protein BC364_17025 [Ensifer sp. LC499]
MADTNIDYLLTVFGEHLITPVPPMPRLVTSIPVAAGDTVEHTFDDTTEFMSFRVPPGTEGASMLGGSMAEASGKTFLPIYPGDEGRKVDPGSKVCIKNSGASAIEIYIAEI